MTTAITSAIPSADPVADVRDWLADNWDPGLTVAEWWERLGLAGWSAPTLPIESYGRGISRSDAVAVAKAISDFGALNAPAGLGLLLAAPTITTHGTREQIDLYVRDIVTGKKAWCQLFSEPGAGSDLAGLSTRAELDGDEWIINGQKVWTSLGQSADLGMLIARTSPDAPKHQGITWMAIDMHQPQVEIRPLIEMTGHAMFSEVFMTDARVHDDAVIGGVNKGWAAANTTLQNERAGLGAGGGGGGASITPGTIAGNLGRQAGDLAQRGDNLRRPIGGVARRGSMMNEFAAGLGKNTDPSIRQDLVRLHILNEVGRLNGMRAKDVRAAGGDIAGIANISKLLMSDVVRLSRDVGLQMLGPSGMLHAYTEAQRAQLDDATGNPMLGMITGQALYAQAPPIYGGTDQIQKNIIGERALGLPREPGHDKNMPFSELPKNA
ncbi:MAG: acyl-CoA dehydrogenase family protein [Acidimicrobiia bacterium]|nr:acyl-CoA dehydrogenase family protein [Acidimicrobiia bacterium]